MDITVSQPRPRTLPQNRPLASKTSVQETSGPKSSVDGFAFSQNDDSVLSKSLVGAVLGTIASAIPALGLAQNGITGSLGTAAVLLGGAAIGGALLANADVEIGFAPG